MVSPLQTVQYTVLLCAMSMFDDDDEKIIKSGGGGGEQLFLRAEKKRKGYRYCFRQRSKTDRRLGKQEL